MSEGPAREETPTGGPLRIFVNYRRAETRFHTTQLREALAQRFGEENIFWDIDTIDLGVDFVEAINEAVGSCDVFVAVIGKEWASITDESGERRLDNPEDYVRLEIEAALSRGVRVIPARVQGAAMPRSTELPELLRPLARRNGLELTDTHWQYDVARLVRALENVERERTHEEGGAGASVEQVEIEPARPALPREVEVARRTPPEPASPVGGAREAAATEHGAPEHGSDVGRPRPSDILASILLAAAALVGVLVGTIVAATEEGRGSDALLVFLLVALPPAALALLLATTRKGTPQLVLAALVVAAALGVVVLTFSSDAGAYAPWLVLSAVLALAGAGVTAARARRPVAGR